MSAVVIGRNLIPVVDRANKTGNKMEIARDRDAVVSLFPDLGQSIF